MLCAAEKGCEMKKWKVSVCKRGGATVTQEPNKAYEVVVEADGFLVEDGYLVFDNEDGNVAAFVEWESVRLIGDSCCGQKCDES